MEIVGKGILVRGEIIFKYDFKFPYFVVDDLQLYIDNCWSYPSN